MPQIQLQNVGTRKILHTKGSLSGKPHQVGQKKLALEKKYSRSP